MVPFGELKQGCGPERGRETKKFFIYTKERLVFNWVFRFTVKTSPFASEDRSGLVRKHVQCLKKAILKMYFYIYHGNLFISIVIIDIYKYLLLNPPDVFVEEIQIQIEIDQI